MFAQSQQSNVFLAPYEIQFSYYIDVYAYLNSIKKNITVKFGL